MSTYKSSPPPVERKVALGTLATYLACTAGLAVLNAVSADASLIAPLPDVLETLVLPLVPTGIAFLVGYQARHTPRRDLDE